VQNEHTHTQQRLNDAREELKESDRLKWELDMRKRNAEKEWLALEKKLKAQLAEVKKEKTMIQHRDNQYKVR
jgi:hypothetical protein